MKTDKRKGNKGMWIALLIIIGLIALIIVSVNVGISIMKHEYGPRLEIPRIKVEESG